MDTDLFGVLATEDAAEQERIAGTRAQAAVRVRVAHSFSNYLKLAKSAEDFAARVDLTADRVQAIVSAACEEYGTENETGVLAAAVAELHTAGGHPSGCTCGFCKNKGQLFKKDDEKDDEGEEKEEEKDSDDDEMEKESKSHLLTRDAAASALWHTAAEPLETGDSYTSESVDLPAADSSGLGSEGSPQIDKDRVPKDGLKPIDIPSTAHPHEVQSITETERPKNGTGDPNPSGAVREQIDADKPLQPEHNVAPHSDTWNGTAGQADPVTSSVASKWRVLRT